MELILPLTLTVLSALLAYNIATDRGADAKFWVLMTIIFGLIALPFIFLARRKPRGKENNNAIGYLKA